VYIKQPNLDQLTMMCGSGLPLGFKPEPINLSDEGDTAARV